MNGIGIVGCGGRIRGIAQRVLENSPELRVVGLFDPRPESVAAAQATLNATNARVCANVAELVNDPAVDWVFVGSWNCFHKEAVVAAFAAGKHVFCEKPLALSIADCVAVREAWRASGKMFTIGFTLRYSAHYHKLKELIDGGAIGYPISMEFNETLEFNHGGFIHADWRRRREWAGTHLLEKCCHDVDLVNWLVGSKARRVAGFGGLDFFKPENVHHMERLGKDEKGRGAYAAWPRKTPVDPFTADKDIVDNQVAIIEFENNVRTTFHTNCNSGIPERRMYINGSEGAIRADVLTGNIELARIGFGETIRNIDSGVKGGHGGGDTVLARSLTDTILHGAASVTSVDDGIRSAVTCFGIDRATDEGRVVEMAPLWRQAGYAPETETRKAGAALEVAAV